MRARVREQRILLNLTRNEADHLEEILLDFLDLAEIAPTSADQWKAGLARRLSALLSESTNEAHRQAMSLSIARGNDRRRI